MQRFPFQKGRKMKEYTKGLYDPGGVGGLKGEVADAAKV